MAKLSIRNSRYTYLNGGDLPPAALDVHHVLVHKSFLKPLLLSLSALLLVVNSFFLFHLKENLTSLLLLSFLLSGFLAVLLRWKPVKQESVIIMPALGVQLETHYSREKIIRRFIPFGKILKPVLVECVTPVTCYWSLSLIIREEKELMLVFKELRPPVKMLLPIWKALCSATGTEEAPGNFRDDD